VCAEAGTPRWRATGVASFRGGRYADGARCRCQRHRRRLPARSARAGYVATCSWVLPSVVANACSAVVVQRGSSGAQRATTRGRRNACRSEEAKGVCPLQQARAVMPLVGGCAAGGASRKRRGAAVVRQRARAACRDSAVYVVVCGGGGGAVARCVRGRACARPPRPLRIMTERVPTRTTALT